MAGVPSELTVRTESVQQLYSRYLADRFLVNRRYQRKLVWTVEEKQRLIDSLLRDLPVPLFLVAETTDHDGPVFELIDGMQRLNAVFAFLENEYPVEGTYFNLDTLADTKLLKDQGNLVQQEPIMSRERSNAVANYTVAMSVYRSDDDASVDEVFRRINAGGRRLLRQGLRQAGTLSSLADLVRIISARIRGDTSPGNVLPLGVMPKLSITNNDLPYGVNVDEIFWVSQGVLRRDDVRESADEQLVLDLLLDMLVNPLENSGMRTRDAYYDYTEGEPAPDPSPQSVLIERHIEAYGADTLQEHFMRTYDEIRAVLETQDKRLPHLLGAGTSGRSPRYYHALFIAIYETIFRDRMRVADYTGLAASITNIGGPMNIPSGGGDWRKESKRMSIDAVKGLIRSSFEGPFEGEDLGRFSFQSAFETLLGNAIVEQQLFDCKQGFLKLVEPREFDDASLTKIARTLTAMANQGPKCSGYVVIGVADTDRDAERIKELDGVDAILYRGFRIVGVDRELPHVGKDLNDYWHWFVQQLQGLLPDELKQSVGANARVVPYKDRNVVMLRVDAVGAPVFFGKELYIRQGSDTVALDTTKYSTVFSRFLQTGS